MTEAWHPSSWVPDRPPKRTEVALAVFFTVVWFPAQVLAAESISPSAVAVGFVVALLLMGPAANSSLGGRIGGWFRSLGIARRALLLAVVVSLLLVALSLAAGAIVPTPIGLGFALGSMAAILAVLWMQLLRFRTVSAS